MPASNTTDSTGHFRIAGVAAGDYTLSVSTVGYHLVQKPFHLDAGEPKEFEVVLTPDTLRAVHSLPGVTRAPGGRYEDRSGGVLEVVNLTNRTNYVFDSYNGYNAKTGQASLTLDTMFPVLPSVGMVVEK